MPAAAGARALLSAKPPCRLPRVAAVHANASNAGAVLGALPHRRAPSRRPREAPVATRSFHTSSPARSRADDPNAEEPPADPKNNGATENDPSAETTASEAKKEKLRNQGYGSARARANRNNNRSDDLMAIHLPSWFVNDHVSLYESRPIGSPRTLMFPLDQRDREDVLALLDSHLERASVAEADVEAWKDRLRRSGTSAETLEKLVRRFRAVHNAAFLQALALVHHPSANPEHIERLRQHHSDREDDIMRLSWWSDENLSGDAQRWLSNFRSDSVPGSGALHGSPLASRPDPEYPVCMELLAAVRSQLETTSPVRQEPRRPVAVLSVLNRKGRSVAESVIKDVATDLKADVIHLDAHTIANLVGKHLGQNLYCARGSLSMLGYAAAEMNGRLAPRPDADSEHEIGMVAVTIPSRLRSFLSPRDNLTGISSDGRWEDLKISGALEAIIAAADAKRSITRGNPAGPEQNLIIHVHDYVELNTLHRTIVTKLRAIVDRMWVGGRRVVLVGSSSGDMSRSAQWRDQLIDIGRDGCHVIPFHASETSEWMENYDNFRDNISNIEDMLQAMLGNRADIGFGRQVRFEDGRILVDGKYDNLVETLSSHLYDVQWVYRLASLMVGSRTPRFQNFGLGHLQYALDFMSDRDKHWSAIYPGVRPPYFSPLFTSRSSSSSISSIFSSSSPDEWGMPPSSSNSSSPTSKEYDQHEKKLLSGLINARDIHTTFADIIVPQETKDSLIGLTSLSLIRPEAFSYGVLKTERIPGCLLYGPPGTGKTLLAKAVAKESGANMLEVSAASINDMWLGQSEKNVRALFSLARKLAPMVIFLDEADALLGARHNAPGRSGHRETITQFLREWDGLSDMRAFIMVATNRPFDLDEAVLRRLPRKILVDLPLRAEREAILRVMLKDETLAAEVDLAGLAAETELYSGSDLKNLCVSAAMEAVREEVRQKDEYAGEGEYQFPERRVLQKRHFDKGLREISASISEDMDSLKAIRKFDEQYGDAGRRRRGKRTMGFEVVPGKVGTEEARVRQVGVA
ncbi:Mus7/MMS22 family protein (ATPase) [Madurella fahalii]|uniref:Mus7/MMS22 family protein (ATPase) n=1 Tax=Madurella fahalii TaxID=1157608 RepID=A0ABQ0G5Q1_9PEZI